MRKKKSVPAPNGEILPCMQRENENLYSMDARKASGLIDQTACLTHQDQMVEEKLAPIRDRMRHVMAIMTCLRDQAQKERKLLAEQMEPIVNLKVWRMWRQMFWHENPYRRSYQLFFGVKRRLIQKIIGSVTGVFVSKHLSPHLSNFEVPGVGKSIWMMLSTDKWPATGSKLRGYPILSQKRWQINCSLGGKNLV